MAEVAQDLDRLCALVWRVTADSDFNLLSQKVSILSAQIAVHQALEPTSRHLRSEAAFPNAQSRLSKFMETIYGVGEVKERFQKLRDLDHVTFLFIALSYTPLEITKMNRTEFEYLIQNASKFLQMKDMPPRWIFRDEIQVALASKSSLKNAAIFRKGLTTSLAQIRLLKVTVYYDLEFQQQAGDSAQDGQPSFSAPSNTRQSGAKDRKRKRKADQGELLIPTNGHDLRTTITPLSVNLQVENTASAGLSISHLPIGVSDDQGGGIEEASPEAANQGVVLQAQGARHAEASDTKTTKMARMADVEKLESILGTYLFEGIKASRMRETEENRRLLRFTDTVRLQPASQEGQDFKLEIWLCSLVGEAVSQAKSDEDWRNILGDFLFEAMKGSNRRKEEEARTPTDAGAVDLSFSNGKHSSDDSKLEVMLMFEVGRYVFAEAYP